jgi:hypothetical protein
LDVIRVVSDDIVVCVGSFVDDIIPISDVGDFCVVSGVYPECDVFPEYMSVFPVINTANIK